MSDLIQEIHNGVLQLTLNRPEKLNALNNNILKQLSECLIIAKTDPAIRAVLLTGTGKAFCAGADIQRLADCDAEKGYDFAVQGQAVFNALEQLGKPSIAAVNGFALGGGCELAMSATLRIASQQAKFGQPEIKLGVIPGYGGTQRLARLVGKGRALELCLLGESISAETALSWGLVNTVTSSDDLLPTARLWLDSLLSKAPGAIRAIMQVIHHGYDLTLQEALHLEALQFGLTCASPDKTEGVRAFLEKRQPIFQGV